MLSSDAYRQRRLAEGAIERFSKELRTVGADITPELHEWGGYAAYFDKDYAAAYDRFQSRLL